MPAEGKRTSGGQRTLWTGQVVFGLVSIPVQLHPAVTRSRLRTVSVGPDGKPLSRRYFCPQDERLLESDEIVRGHRDSDGDWIVVESDELDALAPEKSSEIRLEQFAELSELDPPLLDRPYILAPAKGATRPYRLLARVLEEEACVGIATFVMRGKAQLMAVIPEDGLLRAHTLRYHDELRRPEDLAEAPRSEADAKGVATMAEAVEAASEDAFDPGELQDLDAAALRELAESKRDDGEAISPTEAPQARSTIIDLMQTLKRSLEGSEAAANLEDETKAELYERASELDVPGRSSMNKAELAAAIEEAS